MSSNEQYYSIERSVERQVILIIVGVTLVIFTVLYFLAARHLQGQFDAVLLVRADTMVSVSERDEDGLESDYSETVMPDYSASAELPFYLQIRTPDGSDFIKSSSLGEDQLDWIQGTGDRPDIRDIILPNGQAGRQVSMTFIPRPEEGPDEAVPMRAVDPMLLRLTIAHSRQKLDRALMLLVLALAGSALVLTVGLVAGIRQIVRTGLEPLRDGSRQIESLDPSDLSARVGLVRTPQELQPFIGELNRLLGRVEEAFARESRFSADVAHELRTPLAELRAASQVAGTLSTDPAVRQFFSDIEDIEQQMSHMVEVLRTLARCEGGRLDLPLAPIGLAGLVGEIACDIEKDRPNSRIGLAIAGDTGVVSHGESLRIILRNLLNNAILYSPAGSPVECRAERLNGRVDISVTNDVTDLERGDLASMFERFWQRDPSRTSAGNFGLGLPLVKALSEALGLSVEAALNDSRLTITVGGLEPCTVSDAEIRERQPAAAE